MELFLDKEIKILNQSIRGIHYSTIFGEDLDFQEISNLTIDCKYNVLIHKENPRDHLVIVDLNMIQKGDSVNKIDNNKNQFHIVVEGHYQVLDTIKEDFIDKTIHFVSLPNLISFLRSAVQSITSMSFSGMITLPLINMEELHMKYMGNQKQASKPMKAKKTTLKFK